VLPGDTTRSFSLLSSSSLSSSSSCVVAIPLASIVPIEPPAPPPIFCAFAAADMLQQLCEGLALAHNRGVVHVDVKPDNIFMESSGREQQASDAPQSRYLRADVNNHTTIFTEISRSSSQNTHFPAPHLRLSTPQSSPIDQHDLRPTFHAIVHRSLLLLLARYTLQRGQSRWER